LFIKFKTIIKVKQVEMDCVWSGLKKLHLCQPIQLV